MTEEVLTPIEVRKLRTTQTKVQVIVAVTVLAVVIV